ncbi:MAG: glycosyltransferase family 2 protein [Thermodesulfobacteriota bacterium]|nr:glycosyltransferase family 2 protein [Thermodesulfobacteriota bacterium]
MNVSIIVVCLNEEINIDACLNTLINQTYPPDKYEVIVVDGGSTDRTQELVKGFEKGVSNIRLVVELKKGTAAGRNTGIRASQYDYVAFIDADCEAPSDWLATLVKSYRNRKDLDQKLIAVGGTNIPPEGMGDFLKSVGIALDSYPGSFSSIQGRRFKRHIYVPSLSTVNVLYERQKIIEIGYFDETLGSEAEDADINFRLITAGYRLYFVPDSFVWHKMRSTPKTWLKNMFRYGKGRARLLKRHSQMWALSYTLPLIFLVVMTSILLIPFSKLFLLPLIYLPLLFFYSLLQCIKKKAAVLVFHVLLVYFIQHFGYAAGEVYGLLNPKVR